MDKHTEISNFLRDFMQDNSKRGRNPNRNTHKITCTDNQSIDQIMNHISDQIHESKGMSVLFGDRHMTVISTNNFFSNQTKKNSSKYPQGS